MSLRFSPSGQRALLIDAARLSRMAYSSPKYVKKLYDEVKSGKTGSDKETEAVLARVTEPPIYLNDPKSDAQGYGVKYESSEGPISIIVYRGTSSLVDAFADSEIRLVPLETKKLPAQKGCCVHGGFLGQFKALEQQTDDFLQSVYGTLTGKSDGPVEEEAAVVPESPADPATQPESVAEVVQAVDGSVGGTKDESKKGVAGGEEDHTKDESTKGMAEGIENKTEEALHEAANEAARVEDTVVEPNVVSLKVQSEIVKEEAESVKDQTVEAVQDVADDPAKKSEDLRQTVVKAIQDLVNDTAEVGKDVKETIVEAVQVAANDTVKGGEDLKETVKDVVQKIEQGDLSTKDGAGIVANAVVEKSSGVVRDVGRIVGGGTDSDAVYESFMGGPPLVFTGHSLASQISSIGALVYSLRFDSKGVSWSGFGCPRGGNKVWASLFNSRIAQSTRVKNGSDCIDSIIPPVVYHHVGNMYVHVGHPDLLPDVSLMTFIYDHDVAKYVLNLQGEDTSEKPLKWVPYLFGLFVNTPVKMFNLMKSTFLAS